MERAFITARTFWVSVRPKTLSVSLSPLILATALADWPVNLWHLLLIACCTLLMQMGTNLANDYYDHQRGVDESRIGPLRSLQLGEITPTQLKQYFILCFTLALAIGLYLSGEIGIEIFCLGVICLLAAYCYTGGPFPLSHWMLGEVMALTFFGPVAVLGTLWILQGAFAVQDFLLSLLPGFIAALMMGLNNQRDAQTDARAKKWTPASVWGEEWGRVCNLFFLTMTVALPLLYINMLNLSLWTLLIYLPFLIFIRSWGHLLRGAKGRKLIPILQASGQYCLLYHLCLAIGINL